MFYYAQAVNIVQKFVLCLTLINLIAAFTKAGLRRPLRKIERREVKSSKI